MTIVAMQDMLRHAYANRYAVAAFEIDSLEILLGVISAAEQTHSPVILALTTKRLDKARLELLMPSIETAAQQATVPVAIQFHDLRNLDAAARAINAGCNALMVDTCQPDAGNNQVFVRELTDMAHACGIAVEAGLGALPDIKEMIKYVENTGVDFINITADTVHGRWVRDPRLDYSVLSELRESLRIPLALRGGHGLNEEHCYPLISRGVAKINFGPILSEAVDTRVRPNVEQAKSDTAELVQGLHFIISSLAEECMQLCHSCGQAGSILEHATPWSPIEHVILFNVSGINDQQAEAMMAEGRQSLSAIPGVRQVITARSVKEDAQYRFCWLIRFCHAAVIDSYREHPIHVDFADRLFRPVAGDRISIDYIWNDF